MKYQSDSSPSSSVCSGNWFTEVYPRLPFTYSVLKYFKQLQLAYYGNLTTCPTLSLRESDCLVGHYKETIDSIYNRNLSSSQLRQDLSEEDRSKSVLSQAKMIFLGTTASFPPNRSKLHHLIENQSRFSLFKEEIIKNCDAVCERICNAAVLPAETDPSELNCDIINCKRVQPYTMIASYPLFTFLPSWKMMIAGFPYCRVAADYRYVDIMRACWLNGKHWGVFKNVCAVDVVSKSVASEFLRLKTIPLFAKTPSSTTSQTCTMSDVNLKRRSSSETATNETEEENVVSKVEPEISKTVVDSVNSSLEEFTDIENNNDNHDSSDVDDDDDDSDDDDDDADSEDYCHADAVISSDCDTSDDLDCDCECDTVSEYIHRGSVSPIQNSSASKTLDMSVNSVHPQTEVHLSCFSFTFPDSDDSEDESSSDDDDSDYDDDDDWNNPTSTSSITDQDIDNEFSCMLGHNLTFDRYDKAEHPGSKQSYNTSVDSEESIGFLEPTEEEQRLTDVNRRWGTFYSNNVTESSSASRAIVEDKTCKSVRFSSAAADVRMIPLVNEMEWADDYAAARVGPWKSYAVDRMRFQHRVERVEEEIGWVFNAAHRKNIYNLIQHTEDEPIFIERRSSAVA